MFGIYGPVLDAKLEGAFDEDIIHSEFSPVRPIQIKKESVKERRSIRTNMESTDNRWFNQWKNAGDQPYLIEGDATEKIAFNEWKAQIEPGGDPNLAKLAAAARRDPNPRALLIVQDLLQGDAHETIAKRYNFDRKTIHNVLSRIKASLEPLAK
jgi:hypothetical protein